MNLEEIISDLTFGELSQVNLGADANGQLDNKRYNQIISHLNLGLTDLHKELPLKINHIEVVFNANRTRYHLHRDHRYSDESLVVNDFRFDIGAGTLLTDVTANPDPEYIRDQPYAKFENDILLISRIETPEDFLLPVNVVGNPYSVMTSKADMLHVPLAIVNQDNSLPDWLKMDRMFVYYHQNHVRIPYNAGNFNGAQVEIDLPETCRLALLYFIASRCMNPIDMNQQISAGNIYAQKYLGEVQSLKDRGLYIDETDAQDKFNSRGFV